MHTDVRKIALVALLLALSGGGALAQGCDVIGCRGIVRYVFLYERGFEKKPALFPMDNDTICAAPQDGPFQEVGLPQVNGVVTIRDKTSLYREQEIQKQLDSFHPHDAERTGEHSCQVIWSAPEGERWLQPGNQVRILGYRTFVNNHKSSRGFLFGRIPQQLLFALVIVEQD